jgi:hypothetical protein
MLDYMTENGARSTYAPKEIYTPLFILIFDGVAWCSEM